MGSISAILRIQEVYKLSACVVADGKLHAGNNSGRLGADECYELGVVSDSKKNYDDVIEWMREALKRMSPPYKYSGALSKVDVLEYLSWAEYKVGFNLVPRVLIFTWRRILEDWIRGWVGLSA